MVSGVDTSLIIRINSTISAAGFPQQTDEDNSQNTIDRTAAPTAAGLTDASVLTPFDNGGQDEEPIFLSGLNSLLAPRGIAAVQEENGSSEQRGTAVDGAPSVASDPDGGPAEAASPEDEEGPDGLTEEEQEVVDELKQRDAEVRRHEQAHKAVGGQYAGSISYTYESGPDGRRYAVGGEVPIETGPVAGDPEATIRKLEQVRRAALAPAEPSAADQAVAAQASQGIQQARAELAQQSAEELQALTEGGEDADTEAGQKSSPGAADSPVQQTSGVANGLLQPQGDGFSEGALGLRGSETAVGGASPFSIAGRSGFESLTEQGDDDRGTRFGDLGPSGQSPFDFTPSSGRTTLDVSI
ncbi:putative metalloprotease CJM1_0395 family protein [Nisaea sp.]|uniref:putative metalloprotease CJM1_0395 family protein n=1 Tax=Nisaea sp. TaxID=2024842 RepID=UPI00329A4681